MISVVVFVGIVFVAWCCVLHLVFESYGIEKALQAQNLKLSDQICMLEQSIATLHRQCESNAGAIVQCSEGSIHLRRLDGMLTELEFYK